MDVDSSFIAVEKLLIPGSSLSQSPPLSPSPLPLSAAPVVAQFQSLFYDTGSPAKVFEQPSSDPEHQSSSPTSAHQTLSRSPSPGLDSSPSLQKLERISSGSLHRLAKPGLEGIGVPINLLRQLRRTAVSAMNGLPNATISQSAYPVLTHTDIAEFEGKPVHKARRAFSALLPSSGWPLEPSSPDSPFSDAVEASSPIPANTKKQQVETIEHSDNTDLKPSAAVNVISTLGTSSPSTRYMAAGLSGFGDNEALEKILPCHKVRDDGLMRITCRTVRWNLPPV
jgi:M-phase inducer tyrosine phosphatase